MTDEVPAMDAESRRSGLAAMRQLFVNTTSLLTSDVVNKAANFAIYAMVARFCGAHAFGQLSLGLTLIFTFQVFAAAGLPTLITREIAKRRDASARYFAAASVIAFCVFFLSLAALALLVIISRYPRDTSEVILLLGLAILPWSLTAINEAVLRAWERMHYIMLVNAPINAVKVGAAYYLLSSGYAVRTIALVVLASHFATMLLEWPIVFSQIRLREAAVSAKFCRELLGRAWRFVGIDSLVAVLGSINSVVLSWFCGEAAVGLFGAAWQLLMPVRMAFQAIAESLFPMMCRRAEGCPARFRQLAVLLLEILITITLPGSILLYFGAAPIIDFVYGAKDFAESVVVVRIMLPVLILQVVAMTFGQVLYSYRHEHRTLRIVAIALAVNVLTGVPLIAAFGVIGAAVSQLLTSVLNAYLHYAAAKECIADDSGARFSWHASVLSQVVAAGCVMAGAFLLASRLNFIVASILTSLIYLIVLAVFVFVACQGWLGLRERYFVLTREQ